jgi:hypothetical protein
VGRRATAEVWRRVVDLDGLVVRDPELDLVDLAGDETPAPRHDRGAQPPARRPPRHLELAVVAVEDPYRLVLCVTTHRTRWTVRIELTPCAGPATDLHCTRSSTRPPPAGSGCAPWSGWRVGAAKDVTAPCSSRSRGGPPPHRSGR